MNEVWKDIVGYEGLYQVSNLGRVKSLPRERFNGSGYFYSKEKILSPSKNKYGYKSIVLYKDKIAKSYFIHRLVALAFVNGYKESLTVNHIDQNPSNNIYTNLEWVTQKENNNHKDHNKKLSKSRVGKYCGKDNPNARKVICVTTNMIFSTLKEGAEYYGIKNNGDISACCRGRQKSCGKLEDGTKLVWRYLEDYLKEVA